MSFISEEMFRLLTLLFLTSTYAIAAVTDRVSDLPGSEYDFIVVGGEIYLVLLITLILLNPAPSLMQEELLEMSLQIDLQKTLMYPYWSSKQVSRESHNILRAMCSTHTFMASMSYAVTKMS